MNRRSRLNRCPFLVVNSGSSSDKQFLLLLEKYRSFLGLASLRLQGDQHLLDTALWCNEKGVSIRQQPSVQQQNGCRTLVQHQGAEIQPRSDERRILNNVVMLKDVPPLSEHWQLFNNSEVLFNEAHTAQAVTVVFSLRQNIRIEPPARNTHTLRRQRGSAMKILARENTVSLCVTDERLLLACGVNMVIPWSAPFSRHLAMIESVQGQKFSRYVPEDITTLLPMTQSFRPHGLQKRNVFCNAVNNAVNNPLLPAHGKGALVTLRPVPGTRVEQALTLCRPNHTGDIMTIGGNQPVLFLLFCRVNDLDIALNHIFPLLTGDIFSDRMVWFEGDQISTELVQICLSASEQQDVPLSLVRSSKSVIDAEHNGRHWRRISEPMRLLDDAVERSS